MDTPSTVKIAVSKFSYTLHISRNRTAALAAAQARARSASHSHHCCHALRTIIARHTRHSHASLAERMRPGGLRRRYLLRRQDTHACLCAAPLTHDLSLTHTYTHTYPTVSHHTIFTKSSHHHHPRKSQCLTPSSQARSLSLSLIPCRSTPIIITTAVCVCVCALAAVAVSRRHSGPLFCARGLLCHPPSVRSTRSAGGLLQ